MPQPTLLSDLLGISFLILMFREIGLLHLLLVEEGFIALSARRRQTHGLDQDSLKGRRRIRSKRRVAFIQATPRRDSPFQHRDAKHNTGLTKYLTVTFSGSSFVIRDPSLGLSGCLQVSTANFQQFRIQVQSVR
jgi:hypothetical protein